MDITKIFSYSDSNCMYDDHYCYEYDNCELLEDFEPFKKGDKFDIIEVDLVKNAMTFIKDEHATTADNRTIVNIDITITSHGVEVKCNCPQLPVNKRLSSYTMYVNETMKQYNRSPCEAMQIVSKNWRNMTDEEKSIWKTKADEYNNEKIKQFLANNYLCRKCMSTLHENIHAWGDL